MKLVDVGQMRMIEREADARGWSYAEMMEAAGKGLADIVTVRYGSRRDPAALGLIGSGNNGGDALVALWHLAQAGWRVAAYLVKPRPESDRFVYRLRQAGGKLIAAGDDPEYTILDHWMREANVLIDGVLGTGIQLPLREDLARLLAHVRSSPIRPESVAVDCPSGVDCDLGAAADECIPAAVTVCMAAVKKGLLSFPAFRLCGDIEVVSIGLPQDLPSWLAVQREVIDEDFVREILPQRPDDGHKGTFGTALLVAGSRSYPGAALLAGKAALRMGTGLVTMAVPEIIQSGLIGHVPEATWLPLPHEDGWIAANAADLVTKRSSRVDAMLVGPGLGLEEVTGEFVRRLTQNRLPALVVDADGLKHLARIDGWHGLLPLESVLTPHPGEMAALTDWDKDKIQVDRLLTAEHFARAWGHVVVLKGAFTVVAAPDGRSGIVPVATSALAHAGTGDVLAGMVVGLRAQGVPAFEAAAACAWMHAQAGLAAAERLGHPAAVTAGEVIASLLEIFAWMVSAQE